MSASTQWEEGFGRQILFGQVSFDKVEGCLIMDGEGHNLNEMQLV